MKRYAFFDVDNTLFDGHTTSSFWEYLALNKVIDPATYKKMHQLHNLYIDKKISYKDVSHEVQKYFSQTLKGRSKKQIETWGLNYLKSKQFFFPYAEKIVAFLKQNDFEIHIISGAASPIVNPVGEYLGIDNVHSTSFLEQDDIYDGSIESVLIYEEKRLLVHRLISEISDEHLKIGFGDSTGDVDMLSHMDLAFIIHPHESEMYELAKKHGWIVTQDADLMIKTIKKNLV